MSKITEVIAELREEQARLKLELARIERVLEALEETFVADRGARVPAAVPPPPAAEPEPPRTNDLYTQDDLYEATMLYLARVGQPQTARQIAEGLRAGGFKTRSVDFANTVRTMLRRRPTRGIRQTSDGKRWFFSG